MWDAGPPDYRSIREPWYQAIVRERPSRSSVVARKPKSAAARDVSRRRRGCPFGFDRSHTMRPRNSQSSATSDVRSRIEISKPAPMLTGIGAVVALGGEHDRRRAVLDVQELARRRAVAPADDLGHATILRLETLSQERRNHMGRSRMEVVPWAIQVHRQQVNRIEAVLLPVGLALHEQHLLRHAVGGVGFFRIAVPELILGERHRRELRIGADRSDADELPDAGPARVLHEHRAHVQVLVEEAARLGLVRADAADHRRQVDDDLGLGLVKDRSARRPRGSGRKSHGTARRPSGSRARSSARTTCCPRKPVPPVTRILESASGRYAGVMQVTPVRTASGRRTTPASRGAVRAREAARRRSVRSRSTRSSLTSQDHPVEALVIVERRRPVEAVNRPLQVWAAIRP